MIINDGDSSRQLRTNLYEYPKFAFMGSNTAINALNGPETVITFCNVFGTNGKYPLQPNVGETADYIEQLHDIVDLYAGSGPEFLTFLVTFFQSMGFILAASFVAIGFGIWNTKPIDAMTDVIWVADGSGTMERLM